MRMIDWGGRGTRGRMEVPPTKPAGPDHELREGNPSTFGSTGAKLGSHQSALRPCVFAGGQSKGQRRATTCAHATAPGCCSDLTAPGSNSSSCGATDCTNAGATSCCARRREGAIWSGEKALGSDDFRNPPSIAVPGEMGAGPVGFTHSAPSASGSGGLYPAARKIASGTVIEYAVRVSSVKNFCWLRAAVKEFQATQAVGQAYPSSMGFSPAALRHRFRRALVVLRMSHLAVGGLRLICGSGVGRDCRCLLVHAQLGPDQVPLVRMQVPTHHTKVGRDLNGVTLLERNGPLTTCPT